MALNMKIKKKDLIKNLLNQIKFPLAKFIGTFKEHYIGFHKGKSKTIHVEGILNIHGVEQKRLITGVLTKNNDKSFHFESSFNVPLCDHNIEIPSIFDYKIADEIFVSLNGALAFKENNN